MVHEITLLRKGFRRYPLWDWKSIGIEHYRLDMPGTIIRAYLSRISGPLVCHLAVAQSENDVFEYISISSELKIDQLLHQKQQV